MLLFDCGYDIESGLFTSEKMSINNENLEISFHASYEVGFEEEEGKLKSELFKTTVDKIIPISFCPTCGRKLRE